MPEGTSVGTIYFDLALKDTINAQLQAAAARTKAQVQHAFNGVGDQIQKSISATGTQAAQAAGAAWNKSVALAQLSLNKAVRAFEESKNQLNAAMAQVKLGEEAPKSVDALARRVDQRYAAIEDARQRLAIQVQAAAQRQALPNNALMIKLPRQRNRPRYANRPPRARITPQMLRPPKRFRFSVVLPTWQSPAQGCSARLAASSVPFFLPAWGGFLLSAARPWAGWSLALPRLTAGLPALPQAAAALRPACAALSPVR